MVGLRARLMTMLFAVVGLAFLLLLAGVNFGLRADIATLAGRRVDAGSNALSNAMNAQADVVRATILTGSSQRAIAGAISAHNREALASAAADIALSSNLSFVVVTDLRGDVLAGSRAASGSLAGDAVLASAAAGNMTGGPQLLTGPYLRALGLTSTAPALAITTASPVNVNGRVIGVLYGGSLVAGGVKAVEDVSNLTGGQAGIAVDGILVATSLATKDGATETGVRVGHRAEIAGRNSFSGAQRIDGTDYYVKISPLASFDGTVIGAYWFAVPYAQFETIVNNTLRQIVVWGVIGLIIALIAGSIAASRIGRAITKRSEEVNESARQLKVLVVGGEVSGDHVERTRETLKEIASIVAASTVHGDAQLRTLADRAVDDVVVIDTLTAEMSTRMRDAASRVERLSAVAQELDELVAGARPSRN